MRSFHSPFPINKFRRGSSSIQVSGSAPPSGMSSPAIAAALSANLVAACVPCNLAKGDRTALEFIALESGVGNGA